MKFEFRVNETYTARLKNNNKIVSAKCTLIDTCRQGYRAYFEIDNDPEAIYWGPITYKFCPIGRYLTETIENDDLSVFAGD